MALAMVVTRVAATGVVAARTPRAAVRKPSALTG